MTKKLFLNIIILLFLSQCGYQSIYSDKNIGFNINKITSTGDIKISKKIEKRLNNFSKKESIGKNYDLLINSISTKSVSSKDKKGNPSSFNITLTVELSYTNNLNQKKIKNFKEGINYNNSDNKFELTKYENSLKENLSDKIIESILLYLQTQ